MHPFEGHLSAREFDRALFCRRHCFFFLPNDEKYMMIVILSLPLSTLVAESFKYAIGAISFGQLVAYH